ncbi:hypothetical protein ES695_02590 [Candidatus Atribacteria bacterium 1244-E10-H5-B2]|nr:MAG: hypothetical protein ES695_02590 [Candidatus Atribacteria bacterium 1244-E10-H5-B2]
MKKKLIFLLSVLIIIMIALTGCDWFSLGLLNVFDPEAQIRVNCSDITEGTISLEVYSLNEVEFIGEGFSYKYYSNGVLIPDLSKTVGVTFYVAPSTSPGSPGPITTIGLLLYYQEVLDYMTSNPLVTEMTCTISLMGTDGAGHSISKSVTVDLPAIQPGIDVVTEPEPEPSGDPETIFPSREEAMEIIEANAYDYWGDDYIMVQWEIDLQTEAYDWLVQQTEYPNIMSNAYDYWGDDYSMVKWEYERQVEAYEGLQ